MIGTNKKDATETVELLLEDAPGGTAVAADGEGTLEAALLETRGVEAVMLRRLGGDRPGRARAPASRTAARGSSSASWDALLAAAK